MVLIRFMFIILYLFILFEDLFTIPSISIILNYVCTNHYFDYLNYQQIIIV